MEKKLLPSCIIVSGQLQSNIWDTEGKRYNIHYVQERDSGQNCSLNSKLEVYCWLDKNIFEHKKEKPTWLRKRSKMSKLEALIQERC